MTDFDDIFNEMDAFYKKLMKKLFKEIDELEEMINKQGIEKEWKIRPMKITHTKNYLEEETGLSKIPELPQIPRYITEEPIEPLTDIAEEKNQIKIYMKLPAADKNDIKLTISDGYAEIKVKNFHKWIRLPRKRLAVERTSATYRNGVLKITIPKARVFFKHSEKRHVIKITDENSVPF